MQKLKRLFTTAKTAFLRFFGRLQWKLTLAYTVSSVITGLILAVIGLAILWYVNFQSNLLPKAVASSLNKGVSNLSVYLAQPEPDQAALKEWLQSVTPNNYLTLNLPREDRGAPEDSFPAQLGRVILVAIVDAEGNVLSAKPDEVSESAVARQLMRPSRQDIVSSVDDITPNVRLQPQLSPAGQEILQAALAGETEAARISIRSEEGHLIAAAPVVGENEQVLGAVFAKLAFPIEETQFIQSVSQSLVLPVVGGLAVSGTLAGVVFGFLIARSLTRRLRRLAEAAEAWSHGDFSILARDPSGDELGQLARQFNHMAIQLQNLLQTHEELATLEERNRLARELHDSVKQQIFATTMQVGAARTLLDQDREAAKANLAEAERLVHQAQQELTSLIRELRPVGLEGKGLAQALKECVADWSRQNQISAEVRVRGERPLPLPLEQALFRIAQEGLTNIARHSGAQTVEIDLIWNGDEILLAIADDGVGFNPTVSDSGSGSGGKNGMGLQSMRERVEALGGRLEVHSQPGAGTQVTASVKNVMQFRQGNRK
jgi:NarL family two-component system sensor histidine kinase LiaS